MTLPVQNHDELPGGLIRHLQRRAGDRIHAVPFRQINQRGQAKAEQQRRQNDPDMVQDPHG